MPLRAVLAGRENHVENAAQQQTLQIFRAERSVYLDALAEDQAIVASANEMEMGEDDAATINAQSFHNQGSGNSSKISSSGTRATLRKVTRSIFEAAAGPPAR